MRLLSNKLQKAKGFTLIEILVVIAIIAILITIGLTSYTTAQRQARDAKRRGDLKTIQNALEQYYADHSGNYPDISYSSTTLAGYFPGERTTGGGAPSDPRFSCDYQYDGSPPAVTGYRICTDLESVDGPLCTESCPAGCMHDYCVTNLQ